MAIDSALPALTTPPDVPRRRFVRRPGSARLRPAMVVGGAILICIVFAAVFAPLLTQWDPMAQDLATRLTPPAWASGGSSQHLLGTDSFGRDVLSQLLHGARYSLGVACASTVLAGVVGIALALVAGYGGRRSSGFVMRAVDAMQSMPPVLVALMVAALFGTSVVKLTIVLAVTSWPTYTRILYNVVRAVREQEFVNAAISIGQRPLGIVFAHVLPNIMSSIIVITTLQVGRMVLLEAGLSFLGLGVPLTDPAWGTMLADGQKYIHTDFYLSLLPGLAVTVLVGSLNLFGEGLRRTLNPRG
ncbi:ABC transporter permease [Micromonospora fulviviridis]|uniref:ABC transporter permease n=1 Tax=Micromonospora fulviviridis TaxID=47860 RepID=A0ABV2VVV9_9ACTN